MRRFVVGFAIGLASIAPSWAQANDDDQIAQEIIDKLQDHKSAGQLRGFDIDVQVDQGTVWMKGSVASAEQQKLALSAARRVEGVEKVVNQLKVAGGAKASSGRPSLMNDVMARSVPTPEKAGVRPAVQTSTVSNAKSDEQLISDVLAKLQTYKKSGQLRGFKLDVHADNGVVWLTGHVANQQQHTLVIETVRRVAGVKQVVNELGISSDAASPTPAARPEGTGVSSSNGRQPSPNRPVSGYTAIPVQGVAPAPFVPAVGPVPANASPRVAQRPLAFAPARGGAPLMQASQVESVESNMPMPAHMAGPNVGMQAARYDHPNLPGYAWPSYAAYPNYAAVTYPKQYSPAAWPYIGPFYPYPQVPLGWRKVMLEWDDGWWHLDFKDK